MVNSTVNTEGISHLNAIGWILSVVVPILTYFSLLETGTEIEVTIFLSVLSAAVVMWVFRLVHEYLPGIFVIIACASLGVVPNSVILSGFSSETFVMVFSVLAITILIARSNLMNRFMLKLLHLFPKKQGYFDFIFLISFMFLTPLIPSIVSRTHLAGQSIVRFIDMFELRSGEHVTKIAANAFFGTTLFSNIFLSSSLMNFVILALLPLQEQLEFQLMGWLQASAAAFFVMLVLYLLFSYFFFKGGSSVKVSRSVVADQLKKLGPISIDEKLSLLIIAAFFIGMMTFPYHKISPTWVAFSLAYLLLAFNVIGREEIVSKVDWPFLLFMAAVIGISSMANYFNIAESISRNLKGVILVFKAEILVFITILVAWLAISFSFFIIAFHAIKRKQVVSKMDRPFLLSIFAVVGIFALAKQLGVIDLVAAKLETFEFIFGDSQEDLFVFFVIATIVVRFFLPIGSTIALLIPIFISMSGVYGVTAWAACFTCLLIADMWFFPYQCPFYTSMTGVFEENKVDFNEKKFLTFNAIANIIRILAIFASVYYWQWIGV